LKIGQLVQNVGWKILKNTSASQGFRHGAELVASGHGNPK